MNELMTFKNEEFGKVRGVKIDGESWLVGKDVAEILNYKDTDRAIRYHVDEEDKLTRKFDGSGQNRNMIVINESGLYSLIMSSKLPNAKRFKHWVTSEVLPRIRKTGGYISGEENMTDDELIAKAMSVLNKKLELANKQLEDQKPKVLFADCVETSKSSILVGELAKIIKQNGHDIGQNRLFEWLRQNNYLISRKGTDYNMPTQKSMELGLFEIKETTVTHADGHTSISKTAKVTGKGQVYFINKFAA